MSVQLSQEGAPRRITVALDGSGDFTELESAVAAAADGGSIHMRAGDYRLSQHLLVTKSLRLLGGGIDSTRIISDDSGFVLRFCHQGFLQASGIAFLHDGLSGAHVVEIETGNADIRNCSFSGGIFDPSTNNGGDGLRLLGTLAGTVASCRFIGNQQNGIVVSDTAAPDLHGNTCEHNNRAGIAYQGESAGTASGNNCRQNGRHGIVVTHFARPRIEGSVCRENQGGIAYLDFSGGLLSANIFTDNLEDGVYLGVMVDSIEVISNSCMRNGRNGIAICRFAGGTVSRNVCDSNKGHGIWIGGYATTMVERNMVTENSLHAIVLDGQARPTLVSNVCSGSEQADAVASISELPGTSNSSASDVVRLGVIDRRVWIDQSAEELANDKSFRDEVKLRCKRIADSDNKKEFRGFFSSSRRVLLVRRQGRSRNFVWIALDDREYTGYNVGSLKSIVVEDTNELEGQLGKKTEGYAEGEEQAPTGVEIRQEEPQLDQPKSSLDNLEQQGVSLYTIPPGIHEGLRYTTPKALVESGIVRYSQLSILRFAREGRIQAPRLEGQVLLDANAVEQLLELQRQAEEQLRGRPPGSKTRSRSIKSG
jgi:parallel beta-helix repeat protein